MTQSSSDKSAVSNTRTTYHHGHLREALIEAAVQLIDEQGVEKLSVRDFGGPLIKANFGACTEPAGEHTIGVLLANDQHQPVLIDGKPVIATVQVKTTLP